MQGTTQKDRPDTTVALDGLAPEELLNLGAQQFRAKEYAKARLCFERYVSVAPSDPSALHLLARVYYHENVNLDRACELLEEALHLDPEGAARYLQTMAEVRIHQGEFGLAESALVAAREADTGDDTKLTYSIDFYLNLISRKNSGRQKRAEQESDPGYYSAGRDTRYKRKGRHLFVVPSILLHILVIALMGYLSGYNIHSKEESAEDFMFVEVAPMTETAGAVQGGGGEAGAPAPGTRSRGPAAARPGGLQRGAEKAGAIQDGMGLPSEGPRTLTSEKAFTGLGQAQQYDESAPEGRSDEKRADLRASARRFEESNVRFRPGGLGRSAQETEAGTRAEPGIGSLSDRRSAPRAAVPQALSTEGPGGDRSQRVTSGKAAARLESAAQSELTGHAGAPSSAGEKSIALERPQTRAAEAFSDEGLSRSEPDAIYIGTSTSGKKAARGGESLGTVERERAAARARAASAAQGVTSADTGRDRSPGVFSTKADTRAMSAAGGISGEDREAPLPEPSPAYEPGFAGIRPGRGFSPAEAAPQSRRSLGISADAQGRAAAGGTAAGTRAGSPAGIAEKGSATAPAGGAVGRPGIEGPDTSRSYAAGGGTGRGRGLASGALEGATADSFQADFTGAVSGPGKAGGISSPHGKPGGSGLMAGGGPRGAGSLEGIAGKATGGGTKGQGSGTGGTGRGVRLGSGEKSGTAAPGGGKLAGVSGAGTLKEAGPEGKKDAEGALGVPGGTGQSRYAAIAKTKSATIAPEKLPGVRVSSAASKGLTGGFGPTVRLLTPVSGTTTEMAQVVTGMVSDLNVNKATLTINNDSKVISVTDGRFEAAVGLNEGKNIITVMAFDKDGNPGKDSVTVNYRLSTGSVPVNITEPRDGQVFDVSQSNIVKVRGTVGDTSVKKAQMILNGRPKDIVVKDGRFSQEVAITQEKNTVAVEVEDRSGVSTSNLVGFGTMNIKPKDIMVILTWDKPNADFDLHVFGPLGGHSYFKNPNIYESTEAIAGGQIEQDAKANYGPEVFTMERADKGVYTIKSNYYYSGGDGDANATVTVILYGDNPARRIVRVFGPHLQVDKKTGEDMWDVARFKMPEGIFLED